MGRGVDCNGRGYNEVERRTVRDGWVQGPTRSPEKYKAGARERVLRITKAAKLHCSQCQGTRCRSQQIGGGILGGGTRRSGALSFHRTSKRATPRESAWRSTGEEDCRSSVIGRGRENRRSGCMSPSEGDVRRADTGRHWAGQRAKLLSPAGSSLGGSDGPGLEAAVVR